MLEPEEETVEVRGVYLVVIRAQAAPDPPSLIDMIKRYRAHKLCSLYDMFPVPLANRDLDKLFPDQVFSECVTAPKHCIEPLGGD